MRASRVAPRVAAAAIVTAAVLLALPACSRHKDEGALEKAGKAIDRTAEKVGEKVGDILGK